MITIVTLDGGVIYERFYIENLGGNRNFSVLGWSVFFIYNFLTLYDYLGLRIYLRSLHRTKKSYDLAPSCHAYFKVINCQNLRFVLD